MANRTFNPYNRLNKEFKKYCKSNSINEELVSFDGDVINDSFHSWRCFYKNISFLITYDKTTKKCTSKSL